MCVPCPGLWLFLLHQGNPQDSNQTLYLEAAGVIPKGRVLGDNRQTAPGTTWQLWRSPRYKTRVQGTRKTCCGTFLILPPLNFREMPGRAGIQEVQSRGSREPLALTPRPALVYGTFFPQLAQEAVLGPAAKHWPSRKICLCPLHRLFIVNPFILPPLTHTDPHH